MDEGKWVSMDLNELDSKRISSQNAVHFNPFDVEMTTDNEHREDPPEPPLDALEGESRNYSFVSGLVWRGSESHNAQRVFAKYDDFHTIDWLRDNAMDRQRHRRFNQAKKQSSLDWLRSGMDASSAWICVFLVGLACGVCASVLDIGTAWLIDLRDGVCSKGFWFNREQCCWGSNQTTFDGQYECPQWMTWSVILGHLPNDAGAYVIQYLMFVVWAVIFSWMAATLVRVFAPYASGSGIPEIKTILSGFIIRGYLGKWTLLIKIISLIFIVSSGVNVGKEGPMIHIAACCGNFFAYLFPKYGNNEAKKREIHSAAAAAGISVAFGAPIAGVLFSLEEISYYFPLKTLYRSFFCALVAAFVVRSINPFGNDHLTMFFVEVRSPWFFLELIPFIFLGVFGGVIGVVFIRLNAWFCKLRKTTRLGQYPIMEVVAMGFVTALISYPNPYTREDNSSLIARLFHDCGPADNSALCDYNRTYTSVTAAFAKAEPGPGVKQAMWQLFLAVIVKFVLSIMSVGMKIPAGVFIPNMVVGAMVGRMVGVGMEQLSTTYSEAALFVTACGTTARCVTPGLYAVIGAAAVMGGVTRITISMVVIMVEVTGGLQYIVPLMAAVMTSKWVGDILMKEGIYELLINMNGYPFLDNKLDFHHTTVAADVMRPRPTEKDPLWALPQDSMTVEELEHVVHSGPNGFPIVVSRENQYLVGFVLRKELQVALEASRHPNSGIVSSSRVYFVEHCTTNDYIGPKPLVLSSMVDYAPITIIDQTPMETVIDLFRKMGLRQTLVTHKGRLLGIITKKDVLKHIKEMDHVDSGSVGFN
ncbi:hypothetical protein RvY_09664 [Ramazzottius varieornatus]|uniref:Chloride channel protein n=1 Tax=Ramazzottius varieornatus TaxID=947166 RepID=A0A1D1VA50_RAMVA|nr:hypothetical protein RvY_09664 [Ramazzottius varieornatus]